MSYPGFVLAAPLITHRSIRRLQQRLQRLQSVGSDELHSRCNPGQTLRMKTLLLLRHAKSSWDDDDLDDHDRPLNKRGKKAAPRMGKLLANEGLVPDLIVTSTAKRAKRTAQLAAEAAGYDGEIVLDRTLYLAPAQRYVQVAAKVDDQIKRLMLVGHNPGIEMCIDLLCDEEEAMPTAALAVISISVDHWSQISSDLTCKLEVMWRPKELP